MSKLNPRQKRFRLLLLMLAVLSLAVALLLYAMRSEMNHYYGLDALARGEVPVSQQGIRMGGMVQVGSIQRESDSLRLRFAITDFQNKPLIIDYEGILPDLFRENQGVIARGHLGEDGIFYAREILAKHDENYTPPELKNINHPQGQ